MFSNSFKNLLIVCLVLASVFDQVKAQQPFKKEVDYQWPADTSVKRKLELWQDKKFGLILHWGLYSVPGIMESWTICSEPWIDRDSNIAYEEYKKWYWSQAARFNPVNFNPEQWAAMAKKAGMRYLVFTTKHHDGFNMFDTRQSDFKITAGPFKNDPHANVTKFIFNAFRHQGFMIGAYFSKPDWHSEYYWWPKYATADRNNNYDIRTFSWRWEKFKQFTYNQVSELMTGYGTIDILWLDGGWVRPRETVNEEVLSWGARIPEWSQDIDIPRMATMARNKQPGLLIVDRTVHGPYENYRTPEQRIPEGQLPYPWESCMTLADNWGYVPNDKYKTPSRVIHTLIEVVAKGGNLLLGIGPRPDGTLPEEATTRLLAIGKWMEKNGNAIYETRTVQNFRDDSTWFTQNEKTGLRYAIVCLSETAKPGKTFSWKYNLPRKGSAVTLLQTGETLHWKIEGERILVDLPATIWKKDEKYAALVFAFYPAK